MPLRSGTRFGPYEILAPLGAGGMGEVYRARDTRLGRDVAIKVLPEHAADSPEDRARLKREARAISALNHPHICVLHDIGTEGDTDYLVMELVEGETLAQRISRGPLATKDVLSLGSQIADALDRAHRAGVIHRDLKPGNVMVTKSGAKLMDFGLARSGRVGPASRSVSATTFESPAQSEEPITAKGSVVGTYQYMAPEQLEAKRADARADIWALGCVLYEMATGRRAFEGATAASIISAIMRDAPREMSELAPLTPPALERIVRACLEKDPEDRLQTAHDVKLQLAWLGESGTQSKNPSGVPVRSRSARRIAIASVAAAGIASALTIAMWFGSIRQVQPHISFTPVTFKPMMIRNAAFAPDGKTVVLSASRGGIIPRVYVIRPEYPDPQPISEPGVHLLAVSREGELAVLTNVQMQRGIGEIVGTLARMPLGGGAPREILEGVREADWSPDGTQLAVLRKVDGRDRVEYPIGHPLDGTGDFLSGLRMSPKGDMIAYFEHPDRRDPGGSVNVLDLRGKKRILSTGYSAMEGIAWSANGKEIYFSATASGSDNSEVYAVDLSGRRRYAISSAGGVKIEDVSREGRRLVVRDEIRTTLMVHRPEWAEDRDLSWLDQSSGGTLSQDGNILIFTEFSSALGGGGVMCLRKTDGSPVVKLGDGVAWDLSKDGRHVLGLLPTNPPQVVIQPTGAGESKRLLRGGIERYLTGAFFAGSDSIIFLGNQKGKAEQFFVQGIEGGEPHPVTPEGSLFAVFSPDGRFIAANGFERGWMLYPRDGGPSRPLPALTSRDYALRWSPRTQAVLVLDPSEPLGPIQSVDLVTGRRTPFLAALPINREGLVHRMVSSITDDDRCYAYSADWNTSTLFFVSSGER